MLIRITYQDDNKNMQTVDVDLPNTNPETIQEYFLTQLGYSPEYSSGTVLQ